MSVWAGAPALCLVPAMRWVSVQPSCHENPCPPEGETTFYVPREMGWKPFRRAHLRLCTRTRAALSLEEAPALSAAASAGPSPAPRS